MSVEIPQRGKYRLTRTEEWVLLALEARSTQSVNGIALGHGPRHDGLGWPLAEHKGTPRDVIRRTLQQLERKALVRRRNLSTARLAWDLTDEGRVDCVARLAVFDTEDAA